MKIKDFKEAIKGERITRLQLEFDGVRYDVQDIYVEPATGESRVRGGTVILRCDRFDEIDESGVTGADFV